MWIIGSLLALVGLLPLLQGGGEPPAAKANSNPYAKYTRKAIVPNRYNEALRQVGGIYIDEYPWDGTSLWRLTDEQIGPITNKWGLPLPDNINFIEKEDITVRQDGLVMDMSLGAPELYAPPELRQHKIEGYQYWSVKFAGPTKPEWRKIVEDMGIEPIPYTGGNGFDIWATGKQLDQLETMINPSSFVQWVGAIHPYYRMGDARPDLPQSIRYYNQPIFKGSFSFQLHDKVEETLARLQALKPQKLSKPFYNKYFKTIKVYLEIPTEQLFNIVNWPDFRSVYPPTESVLLDERQDQLVAGNINLATENNGQTISTPRFDMGYLYWLTTTKGFPITASSYPTVAVVDSGVDNGTTFPTHPDFRVSGNPAGASRLTANFDCTSDQNSGDKSGHGSLVASIIGGYNNGTGTLHQDNGNYRYDLGVSPFGRIVNIKIFNANDAKDLSNCLGSVDTVVSESANLNAYITNNSWANVDNLGDYRNDAQIYDLLTRDAIIGAANYPQLHIFAAGNNGLKGPQTVAEPGTAKNVLTVGATENVRDNGVEDGCGNSDAGNADKIAPFSSRGTTLDGRAKPDIVAPGVHIQGAASKDVSFNGSGICGAEYNYSNPNGPYRYYPINPNNLQDLYTWGSGTSFAAPAVAGAAQLVYEYYKRVLNPDQIPSPAMLKALLINSARYLNNYGGGDDLPSPAQGWGALNLAPITDGAHRHLHDQDTVLTFNNREYIYHGSIADTTKPLRITLVWTDAPGVIGGQVLRNDLNLEVTFNGQIYRGNFFKKAFSLPNGRADKVNNVENVFLPPGLSGSFQVKVRAETLRDPAILGTGSDPNQDFALVVYNANTAAAPGVILGQGGVVTGDAAPNGNANNVPEPNELISVTIPIFNNGTSPATGVTSTLAVSGTSALIVGGPVNYGTIGVGQMVTPTASFRLRVAAGQPCGTPIVLTQTIFYNSNQKQTVPFSLATGSPRLSNFTTYNSSDVPKNITDFPVDPPPGETNEAGVGTNSVITITTPGTVAKARVKVNITHEWVGDLRLMLTSPDGRQVKLSTKRGSNGDNYSNTVFDDEAAESIETGDPPFSGSYRPESPLAVLAGGLLNGVWTLTVFDEAIGSIGVIESWSLDIQAFAGYTCAPYEVNAAKIEVVSAPNLKTRVSSVFTQPMQVRVLDGSTNPLNGVVVTFTMPTTTSAPSAVFANNVQTFNATTDNDGIASSGVFTANTKAGNFTAQARVGSLPQPANFNLTNTPDVPNHLYTSDNSRATFVNTSFVPNLNVVVLDRYDNPVGSGIAVTYTITAGGNGASGTFPGNATIYTIATDSDGVATATTLTANTIAGQFTVVARATGINTPLNFTLTNLPDTPKTAERIGSGLLTAVVNTVFTDSLKIVVKDKFGNPISGTQVVFIASSGSNGANLKFSNGNSTSLTALTNASGIASSGTITANTITGGYTVTATVSNLSPVVFYLANKPDVATALALVAGSSQGTDLNTAFPIRLKVKLQDNFGNGISGTTVIFNAPTSGASGTFAGNSSVTTDAAGYAEAPTFTANGITGAYIVTASAANFTAEFKLTNWQSCGANNPLIVTATSDDGAGVICGTLGRALLQANSGSAISFNLGNGNSTVSVTGALPPLKTGVQMGGSSCTSQGIIIVDGSNTPSGTSGLVLEGRTVITNLIVTHFKAQQLIARNGGNYLKCLKVINKTN